MPRTRYVFKTTRALPTKNLETGQVGSHTVRLRHRMPWLSDSDTNDILAQVQRAKSMLSFTIGAMYNGVIEPARRHAATYFLTPATGPSPFHCQVILMCLQRTYNGLNRDMTLKLGTGRFPGLAGYVAVHEVPAETPGSYPLDPTDPRSMHLTTEGHEIHLDKIELLQRHDGGDGGARMLIHEATHKYAYTADHGGAGYRHADDSGWMEPGLTVDQALNNADSYAYFAFHVGRDCNC